MGDSLPGVGDVKVMLGEDEIVLRPSLKAGINLSTRPGGLPEMVSRCLNLDFEAICDVLIVGANIKVESDTKQRIFEAGTINLSSPCIQFLNTLANGGKPLEPIKEDEEPRPLGRNSRTPSSTES